MGSTFYSLGLDVVKKRFLGFRSMLYLWRNVESEEIVCASIGWLNKFNVLEKQ